MTDREQITDISTQLARTRESLKFGGGGGTFDPMEDRVRKLEINTAVAETRLGSIDATLQRIDARLNRMEAKALTEWAVARVVFVIVGGLAAAIVYGPKLIEAAAKLR